MLFDPLPREVVLLMPAMQLFLINLMTTLIDILISFFMIWMLFPVLHLQGLMLMILTTVIISELLDFPTLESNFAL